jgi:uncharacterized protein (DUF488 family)
MGYTKKNMEEFVFLLTNNNIEKLIDIRLKNTSQLAGFAKEEDLRFLLTHFLKIEYEHVPLLSPTEEILKKYKKDKNWDDYLVSFNKLMTERGMDLILETAAGGKKVCLLCAEDAPTKCHRRLVAEFYKKNRQPDVNIIHLTKKDATKKGLED